MIQSTSTQTIRPINQKIVHPQSTENHSSAQEMVMFTSLLTSASHFGNVILTLLTVSITFCNFLNRISKIMGPTMKSKAILKMGTLINELLTTFQGTN
jgi:hypothetical protein